MRITNVAVRRRIATGAIVIALAVLGLYGLAGLAVDFLPDITYPMIKVHVWWRGATPEEIETNLADPIERQMATVDGLDYLESSSIEGMYTLLVNFRYDVDIDVAYQDALAAMARVARQLPTDIDPPIIIKADPSQLPVAQLTISSPEWDLVRLRTWTENWLQDQLLAVNGVAGTEIVGGLKREIRVLVDPSAIEKYGLSLGTVIRRLREENIEQAAGRVTEGRREFIARLSGEFATTDEIASTVIASNRGSNVYLRDIAQVEDSHEEVRVITRLNGSPCVKLSVLKQADANTVEVSRGVMRRIDELQDAIPSVIDVGMVEDQADYIVSALNGVRNSAIEAAVLVMVVVYLFLGSWRQVLVMAIALPLTLVLNFGLMKLAGFSLNIFSLGGLVISIGVLLSNTIVVVENITRWKQERPELDTESGVVAATGEVGSPVVAATLTFLALFVPFLIVPGLTSLLFRELILVVAGIVAISLLVAVTFTPMLTGMVLQRRRATGQTRFERLYERVIAGYQRLLRRVLRVRWIVIAGFLVALATALIVAGHLGSEFLPAMDDGRILVKAKLPTGASLAETDSVLRRVERLLADDELIESSFTLSGGKVWGLYTYEIANEGEIDLQLVPRNRRPVSTQGYIQERLRPLLAQVQVPSGKVMAMQAKVKGIRKLGEADIEMKIRGADLTTLFEFARQTAAAMNRLEHFTNVYVSMDMTKPEYVVSVDRVRAAELGVSAADVATALRTLVGGTVATRFREGDEYYNVRVIVPERQIASRADIENLEIGSMDRRLRVRDLATVQHAVGPVEIVREDQVKEVIVRGDVLGVSVGQGLAELRRAVNVMELPPGYVISYGGQAQMMGEMRAAVIAVLGFAVFFAFVVLAVQFNSLRLPGLILGGIVFAMAGLVWLLYFTGIPLGATVVIGALLVMAEMANDGVLLLTFIDQIRAEGRQPIEEAIVRAASLRLRPITMTTVPMIVGLLPLALNVEEGGDMLQPMAVAAIGGLLMEILVALFLLPCLYLLVSGGSSGTPDTQFVADEAVVTKLTSSPIVERGIPVKQIIIVLAFLAGGMSSSAIADQQNTMPTTPAAFTSPANELAVFDGDVLRARRLMRRACGIAQELAARSTPDTANRAEAIRLTAEVRRQWVGIQTKYASAPPAAYAGDHGFASRLASIDDAMVQMTSLLAANEPMKAAKACGGACAAFVAMHEENGFVYALDRIYHLRMKARTAIAAGKIGGPENLRDIVPELLYLRDRVVLAPCPSLGDTARCGEYRAAVRDLSVALDELAECVVRSDRERLTAVLDGLLATVQRAYGLAM